MTAFVDSVIILASFQASKRRLWYRSLCVKLNEEGFQTKILELPDRKDPTLQSCINTLQAELQSQEKRICVIGHSLGGSTLLHYIANSDAPFSAVFVGVANQFNIPKYQNVMNRFTLGDILMKQKPVVLHKTLFLHGKNDCIALAHEAEKIAFALNGSFRTFTNVGHLGLETVPEPTELPKEMEQCLMEFLTKGTTD